MKRNTIHSIQIKFLTLIMLLFATAQTALAQSGNWTDYRASGYASGSGSQASPYIIKTAEQLAYFQYRVTNGSDRNTYVELGDNIDLSSHWWVPIGKTGNWANGFTGHFDGKGYTISNMSCDWGGRDNAGLFSIVNGGTIQNLIIDKAYVTSTTGSINSTRRVGVLMAGSNNSPVIENIIIRNSKIDTQETLSMGDIWVEIGGLAGPVKDTPTYRNCYVDVDIDMRNVTNYEAKALAQVWYGKVIGSIEGGKQVTMKNIYANGHLRLDTDRDIQYAATIVGYNKTANGDNLFTDNCFYNEVPTVGDSSTPLTSGLKQGTQKAFGSDFISLANDYANGQGDLNSWKLMNGVPQFSGVIVTDLKEEAYTHNAKTISYVFTSTEPATNITWKVNGKTVSADADNSYRLTIPISNKIRKGEVTADIDGQTITRAFDIYPKKYSVDLYADSYAGGTGTKEDPYQISNAMELAKLAHDVNNGNKEAAFTGTYFTLTEDINLNEALWMPIGSYNYKNWRYFAGKLNGNGHSINNMQIYWDDQDNDWSLWGLFASLQGSGQSDICTVSNLIIDGARMEKRPGVTSNIQGLNAGLIVGELYAYTEVSNIIIKNSKIGDNEESYTSNAEYCFGGIIGNIKKVTGLYKIYNISVGVDINLFKNATFTASKIYMSNAFARADFSSAMTGSIYPTNIYVHGAAVETKSGSACKLGTITANITPTPSATQTITWYYVNAQTGSSVRNDGSQKPLADFATNFMKQANDYLQNNLLSDQSQWVYTETDGFNFGNTTLKLEQTDVNTITATTPNKDGNELYAWYVSQDRQNWTEQKDANNNTLYLHTLTLSYEQYDRYVYAVLQDGSSRSKVLKVPGLRFSATLNESDGTYTVNVTNTIWNTDNSKFKITYQWKKNNDEVGTGTSYTPGDLAVNDVISCEVTVTDNTGKELYSQTVYKATVVYLKPTDTQNADKDEKARMAESTWGYSPEKPMLSWKGAYSKLEKGASWTENVIVLMGTSDAQVTEDGFGGGKNANNASLSYTNWDNVIKADTITRNTTITGEWNGNNYGGTIEVFGDGNGINLYGDTRFKNITFNRNRTNPNGNPKTNDYDIFFCQYNSLEMGEGVRMTNYIASPDYGTIDGANTASFQIFGGFNNDNRFKQETAENMRLMEETLLKHGKDGFSITIKSGHYSVICAGGRQSTPNVNGMMGTPNVPIKCTITMDINRSFNDEDANNKIFTNKSYNATVNTDYDAGLILAGNHEGAMYGDVDIIIKSGKVARVVNGTLGNSRNIKFTNNAYTFPNNTYMGRANILLAPASSEFAKADDSEEMTNSRVVVTELYGGSTGRSFDGSSDINTIDNPFYGYSTITINGGTFKILPENNTDTNKIICGIYGAGAGGRNGIGNDKDHTSDTRIPYWNSTKDLVLFGDYNAAKSNLVTFKCYNSDSHDYTEVNPKDTNTKIVINGGVFGTETDSIAGIYAGGSGYMSPGLWSKGIDKTKPAADGGNVYGQKDRIVTSLTINGGTFYCKNGIFAGGRGTEEYYSNLQYAGTAADYTDLGKTYGNVELTIDGGEFHTDIFGGGYGVADAKLKDQSTITTLSNMARLYGKSTVTIKGGTFYGNIYGGGDMAVVEYDGNDPATNVIIGDSADIRGSVFSGGNGRLQRKSSDDIKTGTLHPELVGKVIGSTSITTIGDSKVAPYIYGDIYGGGNLAQVEGSTKVNLYAGHFAGQIFGGGKGSLWDENKVSTPDETSNIRNSANISGNTYVSLAQDQGGQEDGEDGKKIDNFSINVIWDKLWDAKKEEFVVWSSDTEKATTVDKAQFFANGKFLNPHNIYGGGNLACHVGTYENNSTTAKEGTGMTTVYIQKGMTPFSLLKTQEWKESYTDNDNPHFYVFGGGYGANTQVGSTDVTVDVEGDYGIYNAEADDGDQQLAKENNDGFSTWRKTTKRQQQTTLPVFDNSKGIPNFTILGVMGGGYAGIVSGNAKVTIDGNTFLHRVYGGGFGDPESTTDNTTGQIGGNTEVYVQGAHTYGDIFGGGAGVAPKTANAIPFTNIAKVLGTTMVEVSDDAKVYGRVYGGGDIANVGEYQATKPAGYYDQDKLSSVSTLDQDLTRNGEDNLEAGTFVKYEAKGYKSFVNILGGDIFGSVFGGGKGLRKAQAAKYDEVGRINGNTLVHIANSHTGNNIAIQSSSDNYGMDSQGNTIPYVWNRIYGGCAYGTVDGNTLVHIEGGMLGINVFGGGYGDVKIDGDMTDEASGTSTNLTTLTQVLGKKDAQDEGTYANILGNTKVQIDGGSWIWNRFADVNGNITTWTSIDNDKNKICNGLDEFKQIAEAINSAKSIDDVSLPIAQSVINKIKNDVATQKFFDLSMRMFSKNYNIFGGGNRACYVGTYNTNGTVESGTGEAVVEINHSPVADIEDTNGNTISLLDYTTLQGLCWYLSSKSVEHPQFSVFGAGYGANTKVATTKVYVRPGAYMQDNGDHLEIAGKKFRYLNQVADMQKYMEYEQGVYADFLKVSKEDKKRYYGSSDGGNADGTDNDLDTYVRYRASRMAWMLGTPNFTFAEIHGGGFSGYVMGNTYVETDNHLDCRNIFGAGLGAKPYGNYDAAAKYDFGSISGSAKVFIKAGNVSNNVYGGGAGIESERINGKNFIDFSAKAGKAIDFPDMARVNGKTEVHVYGRPIITPYFKYDRTLIFGKIYGGGDVANVGNDKASAKELSADSYLNSSESFTSLVNIRGAKIFSEVFAGGNGRKASASADYTQLGGIYGNACVILDRPVMSYPYMDTTTGKTYDPSNRLNMIHPADDINPGITPYLYNRIYGGCQNGTIYGNTLVVINGGKIGSNIFAGGWGDSDTLLVNNNEVENITSANVTGNTNTYITGGEMELTSYWLQDARSWGPSDIISGKTYSPQYDHQALKFKINHNIYGGGNTACIVGDKDESGNLVDGSGNTYISIKKGLLYDNTPILSGQDNSQKFFESTEWKEVYNKPGSPHFCIFGGGYGENTNILGDTHLDISMASRGSIQNHDIDIKEGEEYKHFISGYSVMDIVGGGYSGKVSGETHIEGEGGAFCRRILGGSLYNSVKTTHIDIKAIDCQDIFGGGLMGDIQKDTHINIGSQSSSATSMFSNADIFVHGSVYGGNDVSGYVNVILDQNGFFADNGGDGTHINIYGGNINGNVYGAGNGDYLYALDKKGNTKVTVNEYYPLNPNDPNSEKEPLVYTVPMRETMPSYKAASDAAKIVNINSWRPMTNKVNINIKGTGAEDGKRVVIKGDVYGGGNSATVQKVQMHNVKADQTEGFIKLNIGSHVQIGRVFMGCNGDALFTASEDNDFMNKFQKLNGNIEDYSQELNLADTIDWMNDPSNKGISSLWLSTKNEERPLVYPHLLDLYFQPVETDIQGALSWEGSETGERLEDCTIGTFCCGGNRGNMNVYPKTADDYTTDTPTVNMKIGNVLEYTFPAGLTITDKIVGGCNNANYDYKGRVSHEGGYLLGEAHTKYPFIKLNVKNKFQPTERENAYVGGNVYGGCYKTGTIRGDVSVVLESDMLADKSKEKLENSNDLLGSNSDFSALNVYGAGYGMESYVYGNTYVKMGKGIKCTAPSITSENRFNPSGTSANFIYGGGQQGNVIGKTDVKILNGHVFKSVTGGSYSGYVWGSTQIRVGYPKYYVVNAGYGGLFSLHRTDQNNIDIDKDKNVASETIKQTVRIISDDVITQSVYDAITARYDFLSKSYNNITSEQKATFFKEVPAATPSVGWDNVNIVIGEAVYGGGYSLAQGSSVMANNTTVLKYTDVYNLDSGFDSDEEQNILNKNLGGTMAGFGGNTTIIIADRTRAADDASTSVDRDHITISRQDMKIANVADNQDLLGYYYKDSDGKYHYIFQAGTYYKGGSTEAGTLPKDMIGTDVYQYDNEGGIFGDGHLSYAQGFRSADLTGYGFASTTIQSPKILNTFQRMDILRLTDNCFTLLGARDYATNAMDKTPYSISRLGEIQMIANDIVASGDKLGEHTNIRARNYMGFANNVHYLGALTSNVAFTDKWHNGKGELSSNNNADTYQAIKQKYIDDYFEEGENKGNTHIFEKRNDGTAKNMIGIASGYALKLLNVQELVTDNGATKEQLYYGPIYGVIEMNLIDVREDEGGGYVYADNVHKRTVSEGETAHDTDFLETTGNFVFPYTPTEGRYIVDDCFPISYTSLSQGDNPDEKIDAHYWYVTGFNYHYTAHITGFTFNSSETNPLYFNSNNQDGIVALSGLKTSQDISFVNWRTYSAHSDNYECDLENRNYKEGSVKNKYILNVGAANSLTYTKPLAEGETTPTDPALLPGFAAQLSMEEGENGNNYDILQGKLPSVFTGGDARIVFQLTDKINNSTTEYYNAHLSEPCKGTLVLAAPAIDDQRKAINGNVAISKLYTRTGNGTTEPYVYTEVNSGKLSANTEYFYKSGETNFYQTTNPGKFFFIEPNKGDTTYVNKEDVELGGSNVYYCKLDRYYTYTIDLTIEYVQGPDIEGHITVENCALPGEMIRLKKDKVVINADQAFSVNGYYWRIGKRHEENGEWTFDDDTPWSKYSTAKGYDTFNQSDNEGKGLFAGCHYDKTDDYLDIPAYYYMNGYGIQLGVTMNVPGLEDILPVKMIDDDKLTVHNYQRMNPHRSGINLHIAEAIKRAKEEAEDANTSSSTTNFAEPRIYIADQSDLTAFVNFVDSIGTNDDSPRYGAHAQFVLQNDLTMPSANIVVPANFAGTFHGNGHVINGIEKGNRLFNNVSGNIYNLGLSSGKISEQQATNGKLANYHCCYEYAPSEDYTSGTGGPQPVVYHIDGTLDTHYTLADFQLGRVAYDLNEYYLRARYSKETEADKEALKYVYDYVANGDYQYAYRTDAITGKNTGAVYLRTGKDSDLPNYEQAESRHDRTHAIDKARAQNYVAATADTPESREGDYIPLFNSAGFGTDVMNDFIFWGQSLQSTPALYPTTITSQQLNYMTNRVYRTAGYYGDTQLDAFHYNAYYRGNSNMSTYVHVPTTTAIDFTCQNDKSKALGMTSNGIYYPPVADNANTYYDFIIKDDVTKNLLVYTASNNESTENEAYDMVNKSLSYSEATKESLVKGHHIIEHGEGFSTTLLHLVERTPDNKNSEDETCENNDLCVPIPFSVTNHAWYTRKPMYYANDVNGAWEGICLPFSVHKAVASLNGEITHFYGTPTSEEKNNPALNTHSLHHEYWLRGLTSVATTNGKTTAIFQRPGSMGNNLFAPVDAAGNAMAESVSYPYANTFFVDTYEKRLYNQDANPYYAEAHRYEGYQLLSSGVPYIVRFPGERYYEFDLSSNFYNNLFGTSVAGQVITFNAYGAENNTERSYGDINIPVTTTMATSVTEHYSHNGTFVATKVAKGSIYGMNADGTAFDEASSLKTIMPFRTYITQNTASHQARSASPSVVYISESTGIDKIIPGISNDEEEDKTGDYLIVRSIGERRIRIESSYATALHVYSTSGQLYRILDVQPGNATYSGFTPGIYFFGKKKMIVK